MFNWLNYQHLRSLDLKQSTTDARGGRGLVGRRRAGVYDPKRMPNHQHHFNLNLCFPYQYIVLLFSLFLVQFSVACACLALSTEDQRSIVSAAWAKSPVEAKIDMMRGLQCCGFRRRDLPASDSMSHPPCKLAEVRPLRFLRVIFHPVWTLVSQLGSEYE